MEIKKKINEEICEYPRQEEISNFRISNSMLKKWKKIGFKMLIVESLLSTNAFASENNIIRDLPLSGDVITPFDTLSDDHFGCISKEIVNKEIICGEIAIFFALLACLIYYFVKNSILHKKVPMPKVTKVLGWIFVISNLFIIISIIMQKLLW